MVRCDVPDRRAAAIEQAAMWQALAGAGLTAADSVAYLLLRTTDVGVRRSTLWHRITGSAWLPYEPLLERDFGAVLTTLERVRPAAPSRPTAGR